MSTDLTTVSPELEKAAQETGLSTDGVYSLKMAFAPHFVKFHELAEKALAVGPGAPKAARLIRLELKTIRVNAEKTRKELKEDSLRRGKAIDGVNNLLLYQLAPVETAMENIEKAEELATQAKRDALKADRSAALSEYGVDTQFLDLGNMPEDQYKQMVAGAIAAREAKQLADMKAEQERLEAEGKIAEQRAAEEAERLRLKAENDRLAKIAEEEERKRKEAEATAAKERAEQEAKSRKEGAEAAEREAKIRREADAKAAKFKAESDRLAKVERDKREAAEKELKSKLEAQTKRIAAEKEAAAKAAAAPDKDKFEALAESIRLLVVPSMSTESGKALAKKLANQLGHIADDIEFQAGELE